MATSPTPLSRLIVALALCMLVACGGGGSSSSSTAAPSPASPAPTAAPVTVSISQPSESLPVGADIQFTATVANTSNTQVRWFVDGIEGGNATIGRIDTSGRYTAPDRPPIGGAVIIRVVSTSDPAADATTTLNLDPRFTPASLQGRYAFFGDGIDATGQFVVAGSLTADGAGSVTVTLDRVDEDRAEAGIALSGQYEVSSDGLGSVTVVEDGTSEPPLELSVALEDAGAGRIVGANDLGIFGGVLLRLDPSAFAENRFAGEFVFELSGSTRSTTAASIGLVVLDGSGRITSGRQHLSTGGVVETDISVLEGIYDIDAATGRGLASVQTANGTGNYVLQVIDTDRALLISRDRDFPVAGTLTRRQASAPSNASLSDDLVFSATGASLAGDVTTIGRVNAQDGRLVEGRIDGREGSFVSDGLPVSGSYAVETSGRGSLELSSERGSARFVLELLDADQAALLQRDGGTVVRAFTDSQSTTRGPSQLAGAYAVTLVIAENGLLGIATGRVLADGQGVIEATLDVSAIGAQGSISSERVLLSGTYDAQPDGRITATLPALANALRIYSAQDGTAVLVGLDASTFVRGVMVPAI